MKTLSAVSETLYVPLIGRIYATKFHPDILEDKSALAIEKKIPEEMRKMPGQNEYTCLASAVRSRDIDEHIKAFLEVSPDGVIVNLGCGLETLYHRNDNGEAMWFELDLPEVLELRAQYFPEQPRNVYLPYSMFDYRWIDEVKKAGDKPVLAIASGLFHYFKPEEVIEFLKALRAYRDVQIVFDTVTGTGVRISQYYVKKMDKQAAQMYFYVDRVKFFARRISEQTKVLKTKRFYRTRRFTSRLKVGTRTKMMMSDALNMVKMIHLKIG